MYLKIILQEEGGGTQGNQGGHSPLTKQKITYSTLDLISWGGARVHVPPVKARP